NDATKKLTIQQSDTTTAASNAQIVRNPAAQNVTLNATVTPVGGGSSISEGTVTFQLLDPANANAPVGSAVNATVSTGNASAAYSLPAALPLGSYTISATYNGTASYKTSSDTTHALSVVRGGQLIPTIDSI